MSVSTYWSPNQTAQAQVRTYTFSAPSGVGNTYTATINGKTVTYSSVSGDTAATVATAMFNLLRAATSVPPEFLEIKFANPSSGVVTATAVEPGTPFAGVTVNGLANQGLVLSTGNGLANGIATADTTPNKSPSDVDDGQNWLRVDLGTTPPNQTRALPQNSDDVVVADSSVPMLWNLDHLRSVQFATYERHQSFSGSIGLPRNNPNGYAEWRATYFQFSGPQGSVPAGGLQMVLGIGTGSGPTREHYDARSQRVTLSAIAAGSAEEEYGIRFLGEHTQNVVNVTGQVSLGVAMQPGEKARISSSTANSGARLGIGPEVTWTSGAGLTLTDGVVLDISAAPSLLTILNGCQVTFRQDSLTWAAIVARASSSMLWLAGGVVTSMTMESGSVLDKSRDNRALTLTTLTIDGDTCQVVDPLNAITYTNDISVLGNIATGPFRHTGPKLVQIIPG